MWNKIPEDLKELLAAMLLMVIYILIYGAVVRNGNNGTDFLLLMGVFWLAVIAFRVQK